MKNHIKYEIKCDELKIQNTIAVSKEAFLIGESEETSSHLEFLYQQSKYRVYPKFCVNSNKWRKIGRNNIFGVVALTPPLGYSINRKLHACQGQRLSGRCSFYP